MREASRSLPDGVYLGEDLSDNDCFEAKDTWIRLRLTVTGDEMKGDLDYGMGTAPFAGKRSAK